LSFHGGAWGQGMRLGIPAPIENPRQVDRSSCIFSAAEVSAYGTWSSSAVVVLPFPPLTVEDRWLAVLSMPPLTEE